VLYMFLDTAISCFKTKTGIKKKEKSKKLPEKKEKSKPTYSSHTPGIITLLLDDQVLKTG